LEASIMTVYEGLTIALIVMLALATTAAIYLGLLNWIGALFVVRCAACHHLTFASANEPQSSCVHCRHPVLTHPVYAVRHAGAEGGVRVVGDRLRY
jgi:type IV secretory pathway TrbD component